MKRGKDVNVEPVTADKETRSYTSCFLAITHTRTHTDAQVLPSLLPGVPSFGHFKRGGAAASGRRGIEEDISSN